MSFGGLIGGIFAVLGLIVLWRNNYSVAVPLIVLGAGLMIGGIFVPSRLKFIHLLWMSVAAVMGHFMGLVILSILFFVVITPLGIAKKILGKQEFGMFQQDDGSFWQKPSKEAWTKETFKRQF